MISMFDTADEAINKTIKSLCQKLEGINPANPEYKTIVDSIATLNASKNAQIIPPKE